MLSIVAGSRVADHPTPAEANTLSPLAPAASPVTEKLDAVAQQAETFNEQNSVSKAQALNALTVIEHLKHNLSAANTAKMQQNVGTIREFIQCLPEDHALSSVQSGQSPVINKSLLMERVPAQTEVISAAAAAALPACSQEDLVQSVQSTSSGETLSRAVSQSLPLYPTLKELVENTVGSFKVAETLTKSILHYDLEVKPIEEGLAKALNKALILTEQTENSEVIQSLFTTVLLKDWGFNNAFYTARTCTENGLMIISEHFAKIIKAELSAQNLPITYQELARSKQIVQLLTLYKQENKPFPLENLLNFLDCTNQLVGCKESLKLYLDLFGKDESEIVVLLTALNSLPLLSRLKGLTVISGYYERFIKDPIHNSSLLTLTPHDYQKRVVAILKVYNPITAMINEGWDEYRKLHGLSYFNTDRKTLTPYTAHTLIVDEQPNPLNTNIERKFYNGFDRSYDEISYRFTQVSQELKAVLSAYNGVLHRFEHLQQCYQANSIVTQRNRVTNPFGNRDKNTEDWSDAARTNYEKNCKAIQAFEFILDPADKMMIKPCYNMDPIADALYQNCTPSIPKGVGK